MGSDFTIASREAWIYEKPELIGQIRKGLQEAKGGKTETIESLDEFLQLFLIHRN